MTEVDRALKDDDLTEEQQDFLKELEEKFYDRFTDKDEEFMKVCNAEKLNPPIVDPWKNSNRDGRGNNRRYDNYSRNRGNHSDNRSRHRDQRSDNRSYDRNPYSDSRSRNRNQDSYNPHHQSGRNYNDQRY